VPDFKFQRVVTTQDIQKSFAPTVWKELRDYFFYFLRVFTSVAILYLFIRTSIFDLIGVSGRSMFPNYNEKTTDDAIYIDELSPKFSNYERGEVVVLISPVACDPNKSMFIKRIIGLPGEQVAIENGKVYIINEQFPAPGQVLDESAYLKPEVKTYYKANQDDGTRHVLPKLGEDQYLFLGDNRTASSDGRICGPINKSQILGKEMFRLSPTEKRGWFKLPRYNIPNQ
jgi:signal peptidase I